MENEKDLRNYLETETLQSLETKLELARVMFFESVLRNDPKDLLGKYLNAYKIASDVYYGKKYQR